jgi:hypothetical protein
LEWLAAYLDQVWFCDADKAAQKNLEPGEPGHAGSGKVDPTQSDLLCSEKATDGPEQY